MRKLKLLGIVLAAVLAATMPAWSQPGVAPPVPPPASILGGYATLSASNVSARTALPAAIATYPTVTIKNSGTKDLYFAVGGSSVAATTSPTGVNAGKLLAGDVVTVFANGGFIALITGGTDTTTANLWQSSGAGVLSKNGTSSGGGAPSGPAGGDLAGTYPNPTVANLSTATGLPLATGITGFGSGVATLLGGAASGTGGPAGTTSPSFVTPVLGVASATSQTITGTAGAGYLQLLNQSSAPGTPTSASRLYIDASNRFSWIGTNGFTRTFDGTANTANRIYVLPDTSDTLAVLGAQTFTGKQTIALGSLAADSNAINATATYNNAGVTFTGLIFGNVTNTASNAASKLIDLQVGGSTQFNVTLAGLATSGNGFSATNGNYSLGSGGAIQWSGRSKLFSSADGTIQFQNNAQNLSAYLSFPAAATWQFGQLDAASPVAQTLSVQNVAAGNNNTAGVSTTIKGSAGTGTGVGGSLIFQTAPAGSTGTAQNAFVTALTLNSAQQALHADGAAGTPSISFINEATTGLYRVGASTLGIAVGGVLKADYGLTTASQWTFLSSGTFQGSLSLQGAGLLTFQSAGIITSPGVGQIQLGANNTSPIAQTLSVANYAPGASNGPGQNATLQASLSTGTGLAGTYQVNTGFQGLSENANVTITNATPAVVTYTAHGLVPGASGQFTTTGTLPTGLSLATTYYVCSTGLAANTFQVSASWTSGACGTIVNTSSAGSGTHTFTTNTTVQNAPSALVVFGPSGLTGSQATSALNLTQTWNTSGTPTALKLNVTNIASNAALLMDLQVGGSSKFNVNTAGDGSFGGGIIAGSGNKIAWPGGTELRSDASGSLKISNSGSSLSSYLSIPASATVQLGQLDAASPVAQTLQAQSVIAGTSNTAGANFTIGGSKGTGTGAGGNLIFQVSQAGSTGTAQNTQTTAFTIAPGGAAGTGVTVAGTLTVNNNTILGSAQVIGWSSRSQIQSPADGQITLQNAALNSFTRLNFGGTTSSFPSLKINGAILQTRLADDSAYAAFEGSTLRTATAFTVSTLPAAGTQGRRAYVTDQLTTCAGVGVAPTGGGAKVCPVFDDGTSWVGG